MLNRAYNDKQGVTALFNKNILNVINKTAKTNFNTGLFDHLSFFNLGESRIEMHLKANADFTVTSKMFPSEVKLFHGETIHTENSRKFTESDIHKMAMTCGLKIERIFTDKMGWVSLILFKHNG